MNSIQFLSLLDLKARMALKSEASKLYLSYLWWVIEPLLWVLVFYFVFTVLLDADRDITFLVCGKIPFLWFSKSMVSGSNSIVAGKGLLNQVNIPKQFFPYQALQEALYKQWLVFLVLFVVVAYFGYEPSLVWFWVIPLIVVQYLFIALCALIGAFCVSYIRDVRMLISMGVMFMMFASGVFWDVSSITDPQMRELMLTWNPLLFLIDGYRQVLMYGKVYDIQHLGILAVVLLAGIMFMHMIYRFKSQAIASKVINS